MLKPNGKPSKPEISADLKALEQRVKSAQARNNKSDTEYEDDGALLGMAWRLSTELIIAVLVGAGLGFGLDKLLGTAPWFMIIGLGFGFAAGIRNTMRVAARMDAATAHIPPGEDLPADDDEED